ncbi:hypothetical protein AVEN_222787-1 [Araneus ventricosus]|uniref:Uncharacterized protein n=1 Tax=Araneus ventricosus TaxID=182803 RepID=A0A4Y2AZV2_ARAVE|nr:hypothetical protein AVEN_222787-1 [Araneus ventricosus]
MTLGNKSLKENPKQHSIIDLRSAFRPELEVKVMRMLGETSANPLRLFLNSDLSPRRDIPSRKGYTNITFCYFSGRLIKIFSRNV